MNPAIVFMVFVCAVPVALFFYAKITDVREGAAA